MNFLSLRGRETKKQKEVPSAGSLLKYTHRQKEAEILAFKQGLQVGKVSTTWEVGPHVLWQPPASSQRAHQQEVGLMNRVRMLTQVLPIWNVGMLSSTPTYMSNT